MFLLVHCNGVSTDAGNPSWKSPGTTVRYSLGQRRSLRVNNVLEEKVALKVGLSFSFLSPITTSTVSFISLLISMPHIVLMVIHGFVANHRKVEISKQTHMA